MRASSAAKLEMVEKLVAQYQHQAKTDQVPLQMAEAIADCQTLLCGGMVAGAYQSMMPCSTTSPAQRNKSENNTAWLQPGS